MTDQINTDVIRVFIADDHAIVRDGIRSLLATEPGIDVVGEAPSDASAAKRRQFLACEGRSLRHADFRGHAQTEDAVLEIEVLGALMGEALRGAAEIPSPLEVVRALAARGVAVESRHVRCVYEAHELTPGKKTAPPT